jgi:hypothetical protein
MRKTDRIDVLLLLLLPLPIWGLPLQCRHDCLLSPAYQICSQVSFWPYKKNYY